MKKSTRVTMQDVARAANVTPQTVSRALRNGPEISEETRTRILRIAEELHYVKNTTASSLRLGNSHLIVIVYDELINLYFSIMIDYLQTALRERGYTVFVLSVEERRLNRSAYEFAVSRSSAGIVSFLEPEEEISSLVEDFGIPVLLFGRRTQEPGIDYLRTDDEEGGRIAARRLIVRGCKRPVYLSVNLAVSCAYDRYSGFCEEFGKYGIEPRVLIDRGDLEEQLQALFNTDAPDGIFCFNDMMAFNSLYLMEQRGLPLVNIIGFDAIQQELHIPYRLTSVGTDKRAMAERAAELILRRIEGSEEERITETLSVTLYGGITS